MQDLITGTGYILLYFIPLAISALCLRALVRIPDEIFRKALHCILLGSLPVFLFGYQTWPAAALACLLFAAVIYPILRFFERFKAYSRIVTERRSGELKSSLLLVFAMFALIIAVCWGWLGDRMLALTSVYAWGFGDAAAALVGKRFGRHKIPRTKKSAEGTLSMFLVSLTSVFLLLLLRGGIAPFSCLCAALPVAAVSAVTELYTPGGYDTFTCPISAMFTLLPILHLFGGGL